MTLFALSPIAFAPIALSAIRSLPIGVASLTGSTVSRPPVTLSALFAFTLLISHQIPRPTQ